MKLIVVCSVATALGLSSVGHECAGDRGTSAVPSANVAAATAANDAGAGAVTPEELRALWEVGTLGITTRRLDTSRPELHAMEAKPIECGSAEGGVATASDVQCGSSIERAMAAAMFGVEFKIALAHPNDCQECPVPGGCEPSISTLDANWSFGLPFQQGGQWCIKATYDGAYLYACSACFD